MEDKPEEKVVKGKPIGNYVNEIFPLSDFDDRYKVKKIIGKGSYGYVAKAVRKSDNSFVAIKKIMNLFQSLPETRRILREIVLLKNCKHPNIVRMIEVLIPKNQTIDNFDHIYLIT
jgi:serine/threonine protein kinase